jgi:c-di-GMP phosphodiesterase
MNDNTNTDENSVPIAIARQPIFDDKRRLWGYELFGVGVDEQPGSGFPQEENVALSIASSSYISLQQVLGRGNKVVVNFTEKSILYHLPYAFPAELACVSVNEKVCQRAPVLDLLKGLKADGYLIAIDKFTGAADFDLFYQLSDIIVLDAKNKGKDGLSAILEKASSYKTMLMAERVQDSAHFKICQDLGFSLFHGPFFKSPEKITVRKLTSNEVSRFNLLHLLEKEPPDFNQIADTIQSDVSISFRLLSYLNSAAFGFPQKIKSIQQAISLLGWRKMKNWLRVVLLKDVGQTKDASELVILSAQRGKFLETIAKEFDYWGFSSDSLLLLGVFSLLDAMLGIPMKEVVEYLPLDNKLKEALCQDSNNEYFPLLQLAMSFEDARWQKAEELIQQLNLDSGKVKAAFQKSVNWAGNLASMQSGKPNGE